MADGRGARAPVGSEWQVGRSAASVAFVADVESELKDFGALDQARLKAAVMRVKSGSIELEDWLSPREFLDGCGPVGFE